MSHTTVAGAAGAPDRSGGHGRTGRGRARRGLVGLLAVGVGAGGVVGTALAANPPAGPGNIEIFTKRDMVAIEGYGDRAGQQATIRVVRGGQQVGIARGTVDATGFLEVNHPGGVCWEGVTPNITGRDTVTVTFSGGGEDGAVAGTADIASVTPVALGGAAPFGVRIVGSYGADVDAPGADLATDPGKMAVEIVNPEMRNASSRIGERAIGWPEEEVPTGYTVDGSASGGTFTVTYGFFTSADRDLALAGEPSVSTWQADGTLGVEAQQGLTIAEFREVDGPGFGGCPAGPDEMRPISPRTFTGKGAGAGAVDVTWAAATTQPAAPAVDGYSVEAVDEVTGEVHGRRLGPDARETRLTGLTPDRVYRVEVSARSRAGESWTPSTMRVAAADHVQPTATASTRLAAQADGTYDRPLVNANGVALDAAPGVIGARIHYTTDGSAPTQASRAYEPELGLIEIRQDTTLRWIVVDDGNIVGPQGSKTFDIEMAGSPDVSGLAVTATPGDASATVTWPAVSADPAVISYRVQAYDAATGVRIGDPLAVAAPADDPATPADEAATVSRRMPNLVNGTAYAFTVAARNDSGWSSESPKSAAVTPVAGARAVAGTPQTTVRGGQVTLDGSQSTGATGYRWQQLRPAGTDGNPQDPAVTLSPATPATAWSDSPSATFRFPLMGTPVTTDHTLQFRLTIRLADGTTRAATTEVTATPDAIVVREARWRAGSELRLNGTGSIPNAQLTVHNGGPTGAVIAQPVVGADGTWDAGRINGLTLTSSRVFIRSDHGYSATIATTR